MSRPPQFARLDQPKLTFEGKILDMATNPNVPSSISLIVLGVTNMSQSVAFYRDTLALQLQTESPEFSILGAGNVSLALNRGLGRTMTPNAHAMEIVFPVQSVGEARSLLSGRGAKFINEPHEVSPGSWAATLTDPDGHYLTIFGPK